MGSILILSGPVGAGKTTVARAMVATSSEPTAYIEGDTFWSFIVKSAEAAPTNRAFRTVMRAMLASARHFERDEYRVIVDFSIPPWYLEATSALLKGVEFSYVVLRPSEAVCAARAAARAEGKITDYAAYRDLYVAFGAAPAYVLDDDGGDPASTAARIEREVSVGKFRFRAPRA